MGPTRRRCSARPRFCGRDFYRYGDRRKPNPGAWAGWTYRPLRFLESILRWERLEGDAWVICRAVERPAEMAHQSDDRLKWREQVRPPHPERVARRAMVLGAIGARADMERAPDEGHTAAFHRRLLSWLPDAGLNDEAEPQEWSLLVAHPGSLD